MSEFTSNKNKSLLWNLLLNNGAFNNLGDNDLPTIQNDFEQLIGFLSNENIDLIKLNKLFVCSK